MRKLALLLLVVFLASCSSDFEEKPDNPTHQSSVVNDPNLELKKKFSTALAKVLAESQDVRSLIKDEALKKIDHDYDVLYQLVKNNRLADGSTLESNLLKYIDASDLALIAEQIPTLTIFVPELPENTFSADLWDTNSEIPVVGIRTTETNDVPFIDSDGIESVIEAEYIPAFPIVLVKENERITTNTSGLKFNSQSSLKSATNPNIEFRFIDEVFDNTKSTAKADEEISRTKSTITTLPASLSKLHAAYDTYSPTSTGWQRDYIYYNISPSKTKGAFEKRYMEHIVGFELLGNAMTALNKISDQDGDPRAGKDSRNSPTWTDGEFEFKAKVYIGSKHISSTESVRSFRLAPDKLFTAKYEMDPNTDAGRSRPVFKGNYTLKSKAVVNVPLFEWDLENYGASFKITIEEVDNLQSTTQTQATSVEFATNFEYNIGIGEKEKIGAKFGASTKETRTTTFQVTTSLGNDELGDVFVNFYDPVVLSKTWSYTIPPTDTGGGRGSSGGTPPPIDYSKVIYNLDYNTKYYNGWYRIYIAPIAVY